MDDLTTPQSVLMLTVTTAINDHVAQSSRQTPTINVINITKQTQLHSAFIKLSVNNQVTRLGKKIVIRPI